MQQRIDRGGGDPPQCMGEMVYYNTQTIDQHSARLNGLLQHGCAPRSNVKKLSKRDDIFFVIDESHLNEVE